MFQHKVINVNFFSSNFVNHTGLESDSVRNDADKKDQFIFANIFSNDIDNLWSLEAAGAL